MKRPILLAGLFALVLAVGIAVGDYLAGQRVKPALERMVNFVNESSELASDAQTSARLIAVFESLAIAKRLRAGDVDGALKFVDDRIETGRSALAGVPASEARSDALDQIKQYQTQYPWAPSPAEVPR